MRPLCDSRIDELEHGDVWIASYNGTYRAMAFDGAGRELGQTTLAVTSEDHPTAEAVFRTVQPGARHGGGGTASTLMPGSRPTCWIRASASSGAAQLMAHARGAAP